MVNILYLSKSTVQYMAVNDYSRPKMKSGPKKKVNEKVLAKICQAAQGQMIKSVGNCEKGEK